MNRRLFLLLLLTACGDATTGRRVRLRTEVTSDLTSDRSFITDRGWTVTLNRVRLSTGPFYYFDGEPAVARRWAFIRSAHAHPGHYSSGRARGQMLQTATIDLLTPTTSLPDGEGVTGFVRSASFSFAPSRDGVVAEVQGRAVKQEQTIHFAFVVTSPEVTYVGGCRFEATDVQTDGTIVVTVRPRVWFDLVDFAELPAGSPDLPSLAPAASTAQLGFTVGLRQLSAYRFAHRRDTP